MVKQDLSRPNQTPEKGFERLEQLVRAEIDKAGTMNAKSAKTAERDKASKDIYIQERAMKIILNDIKGQGRPPPRAPGASSGPMPGPPQPTALETAADIARGVARSASSAMGALSSMIPAGPVRYKPERKVCSI